MLLLINDKKLMMEYTNGLIFNAIAWVTSLIMIGFTLLLFIRMI
jgi:Mn2+/Fe2+ NRAMP family transporter